MASRSFFQTPVSPISNKEYGYNDVPILTHACVSYFEMMRREWQSWVCKSLQNRKNFNISILFSKSTLIRLNFLLLIHRCISYIYGDKTPLQCPHHQVRKFKGYLYHKYIQDSIIIRRINNRGYVSNTIWLLFDVFPSPRICKTIFKISTILRHEHNFTSLRAYVRILYRVDKI